MSNRCKKMELNVFMDETNRTGQQKYHNGKWNFNDQPYFSLGALYIPSSNAESLCLDLQATVEKEHFQGEFKWSNKAAQRRINRLFPVIMDIITRNDAFLYFELEDKRFTIAKTFTEYCVYPYYKIEEELCHSVSIRYKKRAFASYIADNLTNESLWDICSFFDSGEQDTTKLKSLIRKIIAELKSEYTNNFCLKTIDSIEQFEKGNSPLAISNMFPIKDTIKHNGIISTLTIDPHTDCFSDLLCKAVFFFPDYKVIKCIHDEQDQWKPALEETIERMKYTHGDYSIVFSTKSGYDVMVNTVDYISGYLNLSLNNLFKNDTPIPECLHKLCNSNLNLVSSVTLQRKLWGDNSEIAQIKDLYDIIEK